MPVPTKQVMTLPKAPHPKVREAVEALTEVQYRARELRLLMAHVGDQLAKGGGPRPEDWPGSKACARDDKFREQLVAQERLNPQPAVLAPKFWPPLITEVSQAFVMFHQEVGRAERSVKAIAADIDDRDEPEHRRMSVRLLAKLATLRGCFSPMTYGADGLGIVRLGLTMPTPVLDTLIPELFEQREQLRSFKPSRPNHRPNGWTMGDLYEEAEISRGTFIAIRDAAAVRYPKSGQHGFRYGKAQLRLLIAAASRAAGKRKWAQAAARWSALLG